jgi:hypothetical protein
MSTNPRQQKHFKKVFARYLIFLSIIIFALYILNVFVISKKPLFISPMGKVSSNSASVEKILKNKGISFTGVTLVDDYYTVNVSSSGKIKLSTNKDINQQIASLQRILRELTIEGKSFKSIDFRFSEPIITF